MIWAFGLLWSAELSELDSFSGSWRCSGIELIKKWPFFCKNAHKMFFAGGAGFCFKIWKILSSFITGQKSWNKIHSFLFHQMSTANLVKTLTFGKFRPGQLRSCRSKSCNGLARRMYIRAVEGSKAEAAEVLKSGGREEEKGGRLYEHCWFRAANLAGVVCCLQR